MAREHHRNGGTARARERYPSLAGFYQGDRRRLASREVDVGLRWRQESDGPLHRAAWVIDTGELYLVRLCDPARGGGQVELLAQVDSRESLERELRGWQQCCGRPRSLAWLRERAGRLRAVRSKGRGRTLLTGGA